MKKRWICGLFACMLLVPLLSGCFGGNDGEPYPGASLVRYEIATEENSIRVNVQGIRNLYVMTPLSIEFTDASMTQAFEERNHRLRQIANEYFRGLTHEELQAVDIITTAGNDLARLFNEEFQTETIQKVYMEGFVLARA